MALAGVFAERSGIINLALEGIMIFGAFAGVLFVNDPEGVVFSEAKAAGDRVALRASCCLAMLVAAILGAVFSCCSPCLGQPERTDHRRYTEPDGPNFALVRSSSASSPTRTPWMAEGDAASWFMLKKSFFGYGRSDEMGFFGDTFINKAYLATYICIILFVVLSILLYKTTRFGLRLRSCGENPQAADFPWASTSVMLRRHHNLWCAGGHGWPVYALTTANCASTGDVAGFGF